MSEAWAEIPGVAGTRMLLVADHASNHVPDGITLGIDPGLLYQHMAIDIGVDPLGRSLCASLGCGGILGGVSRLVIDLNREKDAAGLIPAISDGHVIPGNQDLSTDARSDRIARYWQPYHERIGHLIGEIGVKLLISLHSFTPRLATDDAPRPWQIGILYNRDDRAARIALPRLQEAGVIVGDNLPYSGKVLNATMNRHGEAGGIPYLGIEVRQDLIGDAAGVARWAGVLAPVIRAVAGELADG